MLGDPRFQKRINPANANTAVGGTQRCAFSQRTAVADQCFIVEDTTSCYVARVSGVIILAATPIGNIGDASRRLIEALEEAAVVAAEDTRTAVHLMRLLGVTNRPELVSVHEHNERERAAQLVERAKTEDVLVLSDAGMPTVSDPGYQLVQVAIAEDVPVTALPGPSAVITALAVSGLPSDRFTFEGFLPRKAGERRQLLSSLAQEPRTMIFFESPSRLAAALEDLATAFGSDRRAVVCRELTKKFEEVRRGTIAELADWAARGVKGEIVVLVAGATARVFSLAEALELVNDAVLNGTRLRDAARDVAAFTGLTARELYQSALDERKQGPREPNTPPRSQP